MPNATVARCMRIASAVTWRQAADGAGGSAADGSGVGNIDAY
jgi:hypothetical protein